MTARPDDLKHRPRPAAATMPDLGDQAASPPPAAGGRLAFPGAPPAAPSFEQEVDTDVSYEKGLAVKALLAITLVLLVITVRVFFLG
jgi:hypothetical protein